MTASLFRLIADAPIQLDPKSVGVQVTSGSGTLSGVLSTVYLWAGILCVIMIIVGGYLYTTANANAQRLQRAKDTILYASVGVVIIILAFTITQYVLGRF